MLRMDPLEEELAKLELIDNHGLSPEISLEPSKKTIDSDSIESVALSDTQKRIGPAVPPKPNKKNSNHPEIPQSVIVRQTCEPLYSKRLQSVSKPMDLSATEFPIGFDGSSLHRKHSDYGIHIYSNNRVTLDNPAILDQQLEALEYHKKQLEKKGLLQTNTAPKLSSSSYLSGINHGNSPSNNQYSSLSTVPSSTVECATLLSGCNKSFISDPYTNPGKQLPNGCSAHKPNHLYSNIHYAHNGIDDLPPPPPLEISTDLNSTIDYLNQYCTGDDDIPPPPSPVSSSYSELRRANNMYPKSQVLNFEVDSAIKLKNSNECINLDISTNQNPVICMYPSISQQRTYMNMGYHTDYSTFGSFSSQQSISQSNSDYYGYGSSSQESSAYESIYEPINPRPPSQQSSRSNYLPFTPYVNCSQVSETEAINSSVSGNPAAATCSDGKGHTHKETEVEALTNLLVQSMETTGDVDSFGVCVACKERVVGENSGCTAMDQIYHISCFTCSQCQINLQGKPFYALEGKPYCESDYLNTLEKCSVCMKPILERILRATGKPYHPQCFTCVVCGKSLDGIPFTVDATNQNYCISDFHKKFAPRCCVCKLPIMPEAGQEETVRVVALDRSFHFECYKCEDCGLLLSSEAEGRGCYPLDDHVLCKSCNAKRVQMLTDRMTTEL